MSSEQKFEPISIYPLRDRFLSDAEVVAIGEIAQGAIENIAKECLLSRKRLAQLRFADNELSVMENRVTWLEQKLRSMREVDGPDYTPNKQLQGRIEGEIGGIRWVINTFSLLHR